MGTLAAGVQYDDWKGSAAADSAADSDISDLLDARKLRHEDELVVAFEFWVGENHGGPSKPPTLYVYLAKPGDFDNVKKALNAEMKKGRISLRRVELEISFEELFGLFKRFNVVLERRGLEILGAEYAE